LDLEVIHREDGDYTPSGIKINYIKKLKEYSHILSFIREETEGKFGAYYGTLRGKRIFFIGSAENYMIAIGDHTVIRSN
jgi:hypothetical protein